MSEVVGDMEIAAQSDTLQSKCNVILNTKRKIGRATFLHNFDLFFFILSKFVIDSMLFLHREWFRESGNYA